MKLFMYSGGDADVNEEMDQQLLDALDSVRPKMTYIPANNHGSEEDFEIFVEYYSDYGINDFHLLEINRAISKKDIEIAMASDVLYLGGGNTFNLMARLRKSNFCHSIYDYVDSGGVVAGESAGAIVLTSSIATASFPDFDRDDNDVKLVDWRGLDIVNFEFFPHYQNRPRYSKALRQYTKNQNTVLMACCDGSGIVMKDDNLELCGEVYMFCSGKKFLLGESM